MLLCTCAVCMHVLRVTKWNIQTLLRPPPSLQVGKGPGVGKGWEAGRRLCVELGARQGWERCWRRAQGVLGTGPRRKPAQQRWWCHGNSAQSTGLLTPHPLTLRVCGGLQVSWGAACSAFGAQCPGSLGPPPGPPLHYGSWARPKETVSSSVTGGGGCRNVQHLVGGCPALEAPPRLLVGRGPSGRERAWRCPAWKSWGSL